MTTLSTTGSGRMMYILEILGFAYLFATDHNASFSGAWYSSGNFAGTKPWLRWAGITHDERATWGEGRTEVTDIDLEIVDYDGGMTALVKSSEGRAATRLAATLDAGHTAAMTVVSTAAFASSGYIWIGQECIKYSGKTATTFTGLTRGYHNSEDVEHAYNGDSTPPRMPVVADGVTFLEGRRCRIYAAAIDESGGDSEQTPTCIYRGIIGELAAMGGVWSLPVSNITEILAREMGKGFPESTCDGQYSYADPDDAAAGGLGRVQFEDFDADAGTSTLYEIEIDAEWYDSPEALAREFNLEAAATVGSAYFPQAGRNIDDPDKWWIYCMTQSDHRYTLTIQPGDPLWALGFEQGTYVSAVGGQLKKEAKDKPRALVCEVRRAGDYRPRIDVHKPELFEVGQAIWCKDNPWVILDEIDGSTLYLKAGNIDPLRSTTYWAIEKEEDLTVKHCLPTSFGGTYDDVTDAAKRLLGLLSGQSEPATWLATGITSADVDWDELDDALEGAPMAMRYCAATITEPASWYDIIAPQLALLGVFPRITTDAKLGFARVRDPVAAQAETVELDSDMWSNREAPQVATRPGGEPQLSRLGIEHSYDYVTEKWGQPIGYELYDTWVELRATRERVLKCRGLAVSGALPICAPTTSDLSATMEPYALSAHLGVYGRNAPVIDVPCTWTARQLLVGDIVAITHPCVTDSAQGDVGATERYGMVVGRVHPWTDDEPDVLMVQLPPPSYAGAIAPCALGDSWTVGTLTMGFSDTSLYAQTGETDLDYFVSTSTMDVVLINYDASTLTRRTATIVANGVDASAKTVEFSADPFSGAGIPADGVWMVFADYDDASGDQQEWLYIADAAAVPSLGAGSDDGNRWGT